MDAASPQGQWLEAELTSVDRVKPPFVIVMGHRPRMSSSVNAGMTSSVTSLGDFLKKHEVDLYM